MDGGHVNRAGIGESADSEALGFRPGSPFYSGTEKANETTYGGMTGPEESMTGSFDQYALVDDLAVTKILCEIYCYKLELSSSAAAIDIARGLGEIPPRRSPTPQSNFVVHRRRLRPCGIVSHGCAQDGAFGVRGI